MGKVIKKLQWINNLAFLVLTEDGLSQFVRNALAMFRLWLTHCYGTENRQ